MKHILPALIHVSIKYSDSYVEKVQILVQLTECGYLTRKRGKDDLQSSELEKLYFPHYIVYYLIQHSREGGELAALLSCRVNYFVVFHRFFSSGFKFRLP